MNLQAVPKQVAHDVALRILSSHEPVFDLAAIVAEIDEMPEPETATEEDQTNE